MEQLNRWFLPPRHRRKAKDNDRLTVEQRLLLQKAHKEGSAKWGMKQIRTMSKIFNKQSDNIVSWLKREKKRCKLSSVTYKMKITDKYSTDK